jgi:hypothetical protein
LVSKNMKGYKKQMSVLFDFNDEAKWKRIFNFHEHYHIRCNCNLRFSNFLTYFCD